jgi:hypothetical protein
LSEVRNPRVHEGANCIQADGTAPPSFVGDKLQEIDENQDQEYQEKVIQNTAGVMYMGGFDTVHHFFLIYYLLS